MKLFIQQEALAKTLQIVSRSLLSKANLPILANFLMTASTNQVEILSTDLETATRVVVPCKVEIESKTTVPGRALTELVCQLPEGDVSLEKLGEEVLVSTKGFSARLATMSPEDFPTIPKIEKGQEITMETKDFADNANRVAFCAAQDEGRPTLTGTLLEIGNNKLSMVATDGYRLSFREVVVSKTEKALRVVVPAKAIMEVTRIILENFSQKTNEPMTIVVSDNLNQINFRLANTEFTSRLIEGEFPNWQKIIPGAFPTKIKVAKAEFIHLIRIAAVFAREAGNIVRLKFETENPKTKKGKMTVLAQAPQLGATDAATEVEISGKGGEIAFNFRYLLETLSVIEDEEVYFEMIESLNPGRFTGADGKDNSFYIIMPVRLQT